MLPTNNIYFDFIYLEKTNEIIANYETSIPIYSQGLTKINIDSKEITNITFPNQKGYRPISTNTKLFGFDSGSSPKRIIELNEANGDIISELAVLPTNNIYFDFIYLEKTNEIIANYETSTPIYSQGLTKINIDSKEITNITFPNQKGYRPIN